MVQLLHLYITTGKKRSFDYPFCFNQFVLGFLSLAISRALTVQGQKSPEGSEWGQDGVPPRNPDLWMDQSQSRSGSSTLVVERVKDECVCVWGGGGGVAHTCACTPAHAYLAHYSLSLPVSTPGLGLCDPWRSQYHLFDSPSFLRTCWEVPLGAWGLAKGRRGGLPGPPA